MKSNRLQRIRTLGQSVWLDYIDRAMLKDGALERLIRGDGLAGMTSNPAIFEKAISKGGPYAGEIKRLAGAGATREQLYERLILEDIAAAADLFRGVYEASDGGDGYVSIEVSPLLARDTEVTVMEARELWQKLARPNVMIKVPGTREGLPAVRTLISEGINVNVTLLFSVARYLQVLDAYMDGLEDRLALDLPLRGVASVASFFLSRIDVAVDARLDAMARDDPGQEQACRALRGQAAIASAAHAFLRFREVTADARWQRLSGAGAQVQRLLWASTGTKDPDYSDVKYVEPLIAPQTINTLPPETLAAYRDHGDPQPRIEQALASAPGVFRELAERGIELRAIDEQLEAEGIEKFVNPYRKLLATLDAVASGNTAT